jgi:hypothetical protein
MNWDPTWDCELAETYAGVYGDMSYEKALVEDALRRHCEQILQPYWDKRETCEDVIAKIEKLQPEPEKVNA